MFSSETTLTVRTYNKSFIMIRNSFKRPDSKPSPNPELNSNSGGASGQIQAQPLHSPLIKTNPLKSQKITSMNPVANQPVSSLPNWHTNYLLTGVNCFADVHPAGYDPVAHSLATVAAKAGLQVAPANQLRQWVKKRLEYPKRECKLHWRQQQQQLGWPSLENWNYNGIWLAPRKWQETHQFSLAHPSQSKLQLPDKEQWGTLSPASE